jgi:predicted DCC family thiol-disulfide oxidoreductase YuxK
MSASETRSVLLYDGLCGFCNTSVQFILSHEVRHTLRFAPLQGAFARAVKDRHPEIQAIDSLVWVEGEGADENVRVRSAAVFGAVSYLGRFWNLLLVLRLVPRPIRDLLYDQFAKRRFKYFGRYASCPAPSGEVRARFLG